LILEIILPKLSSSTNIKLNFIEITIEHIVGVFISHCKKQLTCDSILNCINRTVSKWCTIPIHLRYSLTKRIILLFITKIDIIPMSVHINAHINWTGLNSPRILWLSLKYVWSSWYLNPQIGFILILTITGWLVI